MTIGQTSICRQFEYAQKKRFCLINNFFWNQPVPFLNIKIELKNIYKNCRKKKTVLLPIKSSSDEDPGFRHGFGAEASLPQIQGVLAVSHNTTRLYWILSDLYECHILSDAVTVLF